MGPTAENWAVLRPLRNLRRLAVPASAASSKALGRALRQLPWLQHVLFVGDNSGERFHAPDTLRGDRWLAAAAEDEPGSDGDWDEDYTEDEAEPDSFDDDDGDQLTGLDYDYDSDEPGFHMGDEELAHIPIREQMEMLWAGQLLPPRGDLDDE